VKCICIDPPYNTGNEGWAYNENVNSPAIRSDGRCFFEMVKGRGELGKITDALARASR